MPNGEIDFDAALAFLQKSPSHGGSSVYQHLTDVVAEILDKHPVDAIDLLETSFLVKRANTENSVDEQTAAVRAEDDEVWATRASQIVEAVNEKEPKINSETGEVEEMSPPNEYECTDLIYDGCLLEALGVGLCKTELYEVMLMSKLLGENMQFQISSVRFFGKFFGLENDYYVFETKLKTESDASFNDQGNLLLNELPTPPPEVGTGTNAYAYFICHRVGDEFYRLPDVHPAQIKAARPIRRFLTGNLDSDVSAYPPFPGKEAAYLRAQIARIAATTTLCPSGLFTVNEEGLLEKTEEPGSAPSSEDLRSLSGWCHMHPHLKAQGRCVLHLREAPEGDESEEVELTEEEKEEGPELLTTIENDENAEWGQPWTVLSSSTNPHIKHQVIGVRHNQWSGAYSAAKGIHYTNVYVGWGVKEGPFNPTSPPPLSVEHEMQLQECNSLPLKPPELEDNTEQEQTD